MYLAPLNYDRFFKKVFSHTHIAKAFLEDFLDVTIEEIELLPTSHFLTDDAAKLEFDFRCKINGSDIIIDMQQWYKPDVVKRFYLYFATATTLQLERLPDKKLPPINKNDKRTKGHDYRLLNPVLTLVWMVSDNLKFTENYVAYTVAPETVLDFLKNDLLWEEKSIQKLMSERSNLLLQLQKKDKQLDFLAKNKLIFMFQSNIVKDEKMSKYAKWFDFAEKTRNKENEESDFLSYKSETTFQEIMALINKKGLDKSDFDYIESEDEHIEQVNRYLDGVREDALKEGFEVGVEQGIEKGIEQGIERGIEQGIERGIEQGIERGIEKGREEMEEKYVIAAYKKGKTPAQIADFLDISLEKVLAIIEKVKSEGKL